MSLAREIVVGCGGDWRGAYGCIPGPGHSAMDRSVTVKDDGDGGVVVHSFAGQDWRDIKDDLRAKGRLPEQHKVSQFKQTGSGVDAQYVYTDEVGRPLRRVLRMPDKKFRQQRFEHGEWVNGLNGIADVPYNLRGIYQHASDTVFVVEGEKDADRLIALGYTATTNPGGAGKWPDSYAKYFVDRDVVVLPDNDDAGRKHAEKVRECLDGVASSVRVVDLPDLPEKGDVSNWLDNGNDPTSLLDVVSRLADVERAELKGGHLSAAFSWAELQQSEFPPLKWVVPGLVPEGLTLLVGKPKAGKSWAMLQMGIAVARGEPFLTEESCEQGDVLFLALEDSPSRLRQRTITHLGASAEEEWPDSLHGMVECPKLGEGFEETIRAFKADHPELRMVVVDVLARVRAENTHQISYQSDYDAIAKLQTLALDLGIAIVVVHHTRKAEATDDPLDAINGTSGLAGAADAIFVLGNDKKGHKTLYGRGREVPDVELALEFKNCRYTVLGQAKDVAMSKERRRIREALLDAGGPLGPKAVADAISEPYDNVRKLMGAMLSGGELLKPATGLYDLPERAGADHITHSDHANDNRDEPETRQHIAS